MNMQSTNRFVVRLWDAQRKDIPLTVYCESAEDVSSFIETQLEFPPLSGLSIEVFCAAKWCDKSGK